MSVVTSSSDESEKGQLRSSLSIRACDTSPSKIRRLCSCVSLPKMFERSLQDLIRGLRAHKHSSKSELDAFLAEALAEIRQELRGKEMDLKADAVMKMVYVSPGARCTRPCSQICCAAHDAVPNTSTAVIRLSRRRSHVITAVSPEA